MRNVIMLAHVSLDGFMAGPGGDMSFVKFDAELADHTYPLIKSVDTSVYGRTTYQMMEGYWPGVAEDATAGDHQRSHARWYKGVAKIVASRTLPRSHDPRLAIVADDLPGAVAAAKRAPGGDIMIFGSPSVARTLAAHDLIDEWRLSINPSIIGAGSSLWGPDGKPTKLTLRSAHTFRSGAIAVHYTRGPA
ncbi:MAG TPA: dihydrofolate reductase family protein [Kofleriaceae bacterium]|nr:dihydrofolate reductase family protein [Kofleriaceae bacterium]